VNNPIDDLFQKAARAASPTWSTSITVVKENMESRLAFDSTHL
jgi:hypothetical protein